MGVWTQRIAGNRVARKIADIGLLSYARSRIRSLDRLDAAAHQRETLFSLVRTATNTRFGIDHDFARIRTLADYRLRVPIRDYEAMWSSYWKAAYPHLDNITWPGKVPYYALSSGTTSGATKYLPITQEMLASNRKAAFTTVAFYRKMFPREDLFHGRIFFLGGNTDMAAQADGSFAGDLSAISAREVTDWIRPYTFPPLELAGIADWEQKADALARAAIHLPITMFSGVPAWMLVLFDRMKRITGKATIAEIWPSLRLIIHGGTKFDPYRDIFRREIGSDRVKFLEVYPCSEGFVATEDPRYDLLRIVPDHNIFFEFVPLEEFDETTGQPKSPFPVRHALGEVQVGVPYAVIVTSCAGLWSYLLGDTVTFEKTDPPLIRFTGRTKYFLSAFGEHLISEEIEKAMTKAASVTGAELVDFHVGPVFPTVPSRPGHHAYLTEFRKPPRDLFAFVQTLDATLSDLNEDYRAHRVGDLSMLLPEIVTVRPGAVEAWMKAHGKRPPQHKFPRMDNSGKLTASMRTWLTENGWVTTL